MELDWVNDCCGTVLATIADEFPKERLLEEGENPEATRRRRYIYDTYYKNGDTEKWVNFICPAIRYVAFKVPMPDKIQKLYDDAGLDLAIKEYISHLTTFHLLARMVKDLTHIDVLPQTFGHCLHDMDKLTPYALVALTELAEHKAKGGKFEHFAATSLWIGFLDTHRKNNYHHEQSDYWRSIPFKDEPFPEIPSQEMLDRLMEMIVDKVSRNVEFNKLDINSHTIFDVDMKFFNDLECKQYVKMMLNFLKTVWLIYGPTY